MTSADLSGVKVKTARKCQKIQNLISLSYVHMLHVVCASKRNVAVLAAACGHIGHSMWPYWPLHVTGRNGMARLSKTNSLQHTLCLKKTRHLLFYHNLGKCEPIFKILPQPYS